MSKQETSKRLTEKGYAVLQPEETFWRESNIMKIPNTNLADQLGTSNIGARLWRMPPYSANTWHKHIDQEELYFVVYGTGRIRVGNDTLTLQQGGAVLVKPEALRQVFNDTDKDVLWFIVGAPLEDTTAGRREQFYPEDPTQLPKELSGRQWPRK